MRQQLITKCNDECHAEYDAADEQIGEEKCDIVQVALGRCDAQKFHDATTFLLHHRHQYHVEQCGETVNDHHEYFHLLDANELGTITCIQREFFQLQFNQFR